MKKSVIGVMVVIILVLSSILASCVTSTTSTTAQPPATTTTQSTVQTSIKPAVQTSTQLLTTTSSSKAAHWWDSLGVPQYGGALNIAVGNFDINFDAHDPRGLVANEYDGLFFYDWSVDPSIHPYKNEFVEPEYHKGMLATGWEQTDPLTITVHLREGVHWQDRAPVNGREFTADDVVYNFDRVLGTGNGFTVPNPFIGNNFPDISKVVAVDKYTVQFKLKKATAFTIYQVLTSQCPGGFLGFVAPEWVALGGPPKNEQPDGGSGGGPPPGGGPGGPPPSGPLYEWNKVVGTGPFILSDLMSGSTMTFSKNPNYWGHDERYPQNQLPYIDTMKLIVIKDMATRLASVRTAKIDFVSDRREYPSWQDVANMKKTNPDIQSSSFPVEGYSLEFRCDKQPFTDMNVRKALQMAVDLKSIARSYFGGTVDGTPCGLVNPINTEWVVPFNEWPADLQQEYSYNVAKTRQLMTEAGYPNGFKTTLLVSSQDNQQLPQIIKSMFTDIGVDMTIEVMDNTSFMTYCQSGKNEQLTFFPSTGVAWDPLQDLRYRTHYEWRNFTHVSDPTYEAMYEKITAAVDLSEAKSLAKEAYMYELEQHWEVHMFGNQANMLWQSYFQGYSGQCDTSPWFARIWIDQTLKK
jgi:peptide/nickel transport system substrate-binding protein